MKKVNVFLFAVIILLITSSSIFAQVTFRMRRPPLNQLRAADLWSATITNTGDAFTAYLYGSMKNNEDGEMIATGQTMTFEVKKGTTNFKVSDLPKIPDVSYLSKNPKYKQSFMNTGGAPPGYYKICVELRRKDNTVAGEDCFDQKITGGDAPQLISPRDEEELKIDNPVFTWMHTKASGSDQKYTIKIVEIIGDQSPDEAMKKNPAFFEKEGINQQLFQYPSSASKFEAGKKYAWFVKVSNLQSTVSIFNRSGNTLISQKIKLLSPENGYSLPCCGGRPMGEGDEGEPIMFTWTASDTIDIYSLKIVEIEGVQSPEVAMKENQAFFIQKEIRESTFQYPHSAPMFELNKKYAWMVKTENAESKIWWFNMRNKPSCKDFKVSIVQSDSGIKRNKTDTLIKRRIIDNEQVNYSAEKHIDRNSGCCYDINITNNYHGHGKEGPVSFQITTNNANIISASGMPADWNQVPSSIQPNTNKIGWYKTKEMIPNGEINLGTICFENIAVNPFYVKYEWRNINKEVICTDSVQITCKKDSVSTCCIQYALRLFNNVPNKFKKIEIVPLNPSDITGISMGDDDTDDWTIVKIAGGSEYHINYINPTGFIPADATNFIDANFTINVDQSIPNPQILVKWADINGVLLKIEKITLVALSCQNLADEEFVSDWTANTTLILDSQYSDAQLFAGAEAELCPNRRRLPSSNCEFDYDILPCQGNQLSITLNTNTVCPYPYVCSYNWTVDGITFTDKTFTTQLTGTGLTTTVITLKITYTVPQEVIAAYMDSEGIEHPTEVIAEHEVTLCESEKTVPYCKPTAEFTNSIPKVDCKGTTLLGWHVIFTPATTCAATNIEWNWGDGTSETATTLGDIKHLFTAPGSYPVKLSFKDGNGCDVTQTNMLKITKECEPKFYMNYEWCDTLINKDEFYDVKVTFTNLSICFCDSKFEWDFNDPFPTVSNPNTKTSNCGETVTHIYHTKPNKPFSPKLKMTDKDFCPGAGVTKTNTFVLRPVKNDLKVTACPDGIVKFHTNAPGKVKWFLPTWNLLLSDPTSYCGPNVFDPLGNVVTNAFLGILKTSLPEIYTNLFNKKHFEFRFKDGANFNTTLTTTDEQEYATGTCTVTKNVTVQITCCIDSFRKVDYESHSFNGKPYIIRKVFKLHYRGLHNPPAPGTCIDAYLSILGLPEKTHLKASASLWRKRSIWGLTYYTPAIARIISAGITGAFLSKGGTDDCNCVTPVFWDNTHMEQNSRFPWATYRENTPGLYRVDKSLILKAFYHVEKSGDSWDGEIIKNSNSCKP